MSKKVRITTKEDTVNFYTSLLKISGGESPFIKDDTINDDYVVYAKVTYSSIIDKTLTVTISVDTEGASVAQAIIVNYDDIFHTLYNKLSEHTMTALTYNLDFNYPLGLNFVYDIYGNNIKVQGKFYYDRGNLHSKDIYGSSEININKISFSDRTDFSDISDISGLFGFSTSFPCTIENDIFLTKISEELVIDLSNFKFKENVICDKLFCGEIPSVILPVKFTTVTDIKNIIFAPRLTSESIINNIDYICRHLSKEKAEIYNSYISYKFNPVKFLNNNYSFTLLDTEVHYLLLDTSYEEIPDSMYLGTMTMFYKSKLKLSASFLGFIHNIAQEKLAEMCEYLVYLKRKYSYSRDNCNFVVDFVYKYENELKDAGGYYACALLKKIYNNKTRVHKINFDEFKGDEYIFSEYLTELINSELCEC